MKALEENWWGGFQTCRAQDHPLLRYENTMEAEVGNTVVRARHPNDEHSEETPKDLIPIQCAQFDTNPNATAIHAIDHMTNKTDFAAVGFPRPNQLPLHHTRSQL